MLQDTWAERFDSDDDAARALAERCPFGQLASTLQF